jgi:hypothetical protein
MLKSIKSQTLSVWLFLLKIDFRNPLFERKKDLAANYEQFYVILFLMNNLVAHYVWIYIDRGRFCMIFKFMCKSN